MVSASEVYISQHFRTTAYNRHKAKLPSSSENKTNYSARLGPRAIWRFFRISGRFSRVIYAHRQWENWFFASVKQFCHS